MGTTIIVEDLDAKEPDKFYSYGLRNLVFSITNIISRFKDSIFIVSGGYKAEIAYTNLAASIFRKRAFYMHETSNITKDMPLLPIGLDFKMYEIFHNDLDLIVNGSNMDTSTQTYNSLPEYFREALIQEDTKSNRYVYSPLGMMLNMAYRSHVRAQDKRIDGKPLQSLLKDNESLHDIVNNIIDSDLRQRLNAVLSLDFVSKISFSNPFELSDEPQDTIKEKDSIKDLIMNYAEIYADTDYMQFVSSKRGNITYMLSGVEESVLKYQTVEIKVVGGMENSIMEIIGQHLTLNMSILH